MVVTSALTHDKYCLNVVHLTAVKRALSPAQTERGLCQRFRGLIPRILKEVKSPTLSQNARQGWCNRAFEMTSVSGLLVCVAAFSQERRHIEIRLLEVGDHGVAHAVEGDDVR